jgi:hypothetical protein
MISCQIVNYKLLTFISLTIYYLAQGTNLGSYLLKDFITFCCLVEDFMTTLHKEENRASPSSWRMVTSSNQLKHVNYLGCSHLQLPSLSLFFFPITIYVCNKLSLHHQVIYWFSPKNQAMQALKRKKKKEKQFWLQSFVFARNQKFHPHSCEVCLNLELTIRCRGGKV